MPQIAIVLARGKQAKKFRWILLGQVSLQVHAAMQETQHINDVLLSQTADPEHNEVSAPVPVSGNMKRPNIGADFAALFDADDRWACA